MGKWYCTAIHYFSGQPEQPSELGLRYLSAVRAAVWDNNGIPYLFWRKSVLVSFPFPLCYLLRVFALENMRVYVFRLCAWGTGGILNRMPKYSGFQTSSGYASPFFYYKPTRSAERDGINVFVFTIFCTITSTVTYLSPVHLAWNLQWFGLMKISFCLTCIVIWIKYFVL